MSLLTSNNKIWGIGAIIFLKFEIIDTVIDLTSRLQSLHIYALIDKNSVTTFGMTFH